MKNIGLIFLTAFFFILFLVEARAQQAGGDKSKASNPPPPSTIKAEPKNLQNNSSADFDSHCFGDPIPSKEDYKSVKKEPQIGSKVSDYLRPVQDSQSYYMKFNSIEYTVMTNAQGRIDYISTKDSQFVPPEGTKVGDSLERVLENSKSALIKESRCVYYVRLSSGWNAAFDPGPFLPDGTLSPQAKVYGFFKREQLKTQAGAINGVK